MKLKVSSFFATGFGSGYFPVASGTVGSFVGLLFFFIPGFSKPEILFPTIIITFFIGAVASSLVAKELRNTDPSIVVIDEIVGMWISMTFLEPSMIILLIAFILFRLFDIWKPFPVNSLEKVHGGWGIMLDDVAAGMYANIVLRIMLFVIRNKI